MTPLTTALVTAGAMGIACAVLSVFVVLRRWAFIGEGIAHAGFGGAGTAWMLALAFPSVSLFLEPGGIFLIAILFCIGVGLGIGWITRREQVRTDTAIGIFLVASLAWGFVAYGAYTSLHNGQAPPGWADYVLGHMSVLSPAYAIGTVLVCGALVAVMAGLGKEMLACTFDPFSAGISGVRVGFIHYLMIVLVTLMVLIGMRLMGSLLVTAMLVLPGATGLLASHRLARVIAASVLVGLVAGIAGPLVNHFWPFIPEGPAIVLVLVIQFAVVYAVRVLSGRS